MRDLDSKGSGRGRAAVLAFLLAAAGQGLKVFGGMLLPLRFVLDLGAVLVVRHALAARREPPAAAPFVPEAPLPSAVVAWVGAAGRVAAIGCALLVYFDFLRFLVPVLVLGPLSLLTMAAAEDRLSGYRWRLPRPSLVAWRRPEGEFLILVLAVAALYRFGPAGTFPPVDGFASIEEMQRATGGARILEGARPWEFPLAQYIAATSFALFGKSIHSLRLPVTLLAWLTLPLFYLVARQIVARPAALFATALLAVSRWHCQIGWYAEDVYVPLFPFVLLLYLLLRTRRAPRPSFYIACGALAGYMLYDYAAYRPAIAVALGFFAADALWQRRRPEDLRNIALMVFVTALFTPPLVAVSQRGGAAYYTEALSRSVADEGYYTSDPYEFVRRRVNRIRDSVDAFTYSDHTRFFASLNVPRFPLLDPFTAVFFTLGFGATLLQPRRRYYGFFAATFLVLAAGGMVVPWNFDFRRFAVLIPFAFLFIAFVTHEFDLLALGRGRERLFRRALALVALGAAAWNAWFLFAILAPNHAVRAGHRTPYSVPLAVLGEHYDAEYVVLLSPDPVNFFEANDYDWLKPPGLSGQVAVGVEDILPIEPQPPSGRDVLLLIARPFEFGTVIEQVRDLYPGVECEVRPDPDHKRHDLAVCRIPEGTVAQPRGFTPQLPSP